MELFNTILMKTLYPNNTIHEVYNAYHTPECPVAQLFSAIVNSGSITIHKNPAYADFLFYMANSIFLYKDDWDNIAPTPGNKERYVYTMAQIKYAFLKKNLNNFILNVDGQFMDLFRDIQRHYHAFARFAHIWRHKHSVIQINHDLYMTPLCRTNRNVFSLLQQGKIYLFTAANLANSISAALSNAPHFFVEPIMAKNPYNNVPFNKSSLYNIYFFIKETAIIMPQLFHNYFLVDFDLRKFRDENENNIRNIAIKSMIHNSQSNELYVHIDAMLKKYQPKIVIEKTYPRDILATIMRPYLFLYYTILYSAEEYRVINATDELNYKLDRLYKYNPAFGRKIIRLKRVMFSKTMRKEIVYNQKCPNFDEPMDVKTYQKNHLEIIEPEYHDETIHEYDDEDDNDQNENLPFIIITSQPLFQIGGHTLTTVPVHNTTPVTEDTTNSNNNIHDDSDDDASNSDDEIVIAGDTDSSTDTDTDDDDDDEN
jgi:hypothetical protein